LGHYFATKHCAEAKSVFSDGNAGISAIIVGLFPEDTTFWAHMLGQDLALILGNLARIVFGFTVQFPHWFNWYSIASGALAQVALTLFLTHTTL
jgi:hypothetical protein